MNTPSASGRLDISPAPGGLLLVQELRNTSSIIGTGDLLVIGSLQKGGWTRLSRLRGCLPGTNVHALTHRHLWDESAWGGSTTATRRGYGYYKGMADEDLLNSCRLFWRFNPDSATWRGIEYAVVAYEGRTRAVVRIDSFIGPFWGRHGFRGHMITDPALVQNMVGREVPRRQNPITTIEL